MIEIVLDTETTGLKVSEGHRIVEIGCIEMNNQIPTNKVFHTYLNPQKKISEEAFKVHGYSNEFLSDKKTFSEIAEEFLDFIKEKKLIIHNASFDLSFLNNELNILKKKQIDKKNVIDTLELARSKFPGSPNNLDALCKRYKIDNSRRKKHNALTDCELLLQVYINLIEQKEPKLNLDVYEVEKKKNPEQKELKNYYNKIILPNKEELKLHSNFLKSSIKKNNY